MRSPFANWSLRSRLTLGILILTASGFFSASFATQSLLRHYLTSEVDKQLAVITSGTFQRVQESGIAHEINEDNFGDDGARNHTKGLGAPLTRIPTSASLTLLVQHEVDSQRCQPYESEMVRRYQSSCEGMRYMFPRSQHLHRNRNPRRDPRFVPLIQRGRH